MTETWVNDVWSPLRNVLANGQIQASPTEGATGPLLTLNAPKRHQRSLCMKKVSRGEGVGVANSMYRSHLLHYFVCAPKSERAPGRVYWAAQR
jgi:hypothetical protein